MWAFLISFSSYLLFFGIFLTPDHYFWGDDATGEYIPARTYFYEKVVEEHTFPFWTERMFSGFPIYADIENSYLNPINDLSIILLGPLWSYRILHLAEYLIGSLSLYYFLRRKKIGLVGFTMANAIFYFNTFSLNHQIHFNIVMAFFLIPAALLLVDLFIEKRQIKYIVLQSFLVANAILWGHIQSAIIVCGGIFIYFIFSSWKKIKWSTFFFYLLSLGILVIIETFPQVLPTYDLYQSIGGRDKLNYTAGSLRPEMIILGFIPYLLGGYKNFSKEGVGTSYSYNETYFYLGISSVFLFLLGLLFLKKNRWVYFSYALVWLFLIFGFMSRNGFFSAHIPIVSIFRYWIRTVVLASLGVGILAGMFVDRLEKINLKNFFQGIFLTSLPIFYLWYLEGQGGKNKMNILASFEYIHSYPYYSVLRNIVFLLAVVLLLLLVWQKIKNKSKINVVSFLQISLIAIVLFDLFYFSSDVMDFRISNIAGYNFSPVVPAELSNKRVLDLNGMKQTSMEQIYFDSWSPFGGSQFKDDEYNSYFKKNIVSANEDSTAGQEKLKEAGIVAVIKKGGAIMKINDKKIDIIKNDLEGEYLRKKEGNVLLKLNSPTKTIINTYLRYDPNWRILVDGRRTEAVKDGIFFDFPLPAGKHTVEIYYYPKLFIWGVISSLFAGGIIFGLYYFFKKKIYSKILDLK